MPEKRGFYTRRAHSVCRLTYHAVFVVKYRRKVISPGIMGFMRCSIRSHIFRTT